MPSTCPHADGLQSFLDETLASAERAELETHIDSCPSCQQILEALTADEESQVAARRLASDSSHEETALLQAIDKMRQQLSDVPQDSESLDFLQSSDNPNSIGRLSVAEIDVAAAALQSTDTEHGQVVAAHQQQVERLQYESQLAERQFMKSDPENRLVTGELERRWEASLRELMSAEEELDRLQKDAPSYIIPEDLLEVLRDVGPRLPELWHAKLLSDAQKKTLMRSLIDKVVIHRLAPDQVQTRVVWRGGATTSDVVRVTVGKFAWLSGAAEMEDTIQRMNGTSVASAPRRRISNDPAIGREVGGIPLVD